MLKARAIQQELRRLGDADIAAHSRRFFKTGPGEYGEGDRFLGIRVPLLRRYAKRSKTLPITEVKTLLHSPFHEERLLALLLLVEQYRIGEESNRREIYDLYVTDTDYINNWDLVDSSAPYIVGPHLYHRSKQPLLRLSRSKELWERRISIMSCFFFIRQLEFSTALKISTILLHDREDLIQKAVGWMLREIAKRDIAIAKTFLTEHCREMPRTMLRYAIEKFPEDKRQRYLKGRV